MDSTTDKPAVVSSDSFPVKDAIGVTRVMVFLEKAKGWQISDYVYAPDRANDHSLISTEPFRDEDEARKVFDFRKKAEDERQATYKKQRAKR